MKTNWIHGVRRVMWQKQAEISSIKSELEDETYYKNGNQKWNGN